MDRMFLSIFWKMLFLLLCCVLSYWRGMEKGQIDTCGSLVSEMQKQIDDQKVIIFEKDIDYLKQLKCKSIIVRAINSENSVKIVKFIDFGYKDKGLKFVRVLVDGHEKDFEINEFSKHVIGIDCGDDFRW